MQPGREYALTKQLGMQRQRRSCDQLLKQSRNRLHERRKESEAGAAIEGVAWLGFRKGEVFGKMTSGMMHAKTSITA